MLSVRGYKSRRLCFHRPPLRQDPPAPASATRRAAARLEQRSNGDGDGWLRAGTGERSESIRLMFGGENVMDAPGAAACLQAPCRTNVVGSPIQLSVW